MSAPAAPDAILSREELDALLATLAEEAASAEAAGSELGRSGLAHSGVVRTELGDEASALREALDAFAQRQSRHFSNVYQARIEFRITAFARRRLGELGDVLLDSDRLALLELSPGGRGLLWLGRPLLFAMLCLLFGARPGSTRSAVPVRPYTGIERRVYRRAVDEMLRVLESCWSAEIGAGAEVTGLEARGWLRERADEEMVMASFDVRGLGDVCRMEIALPDGLLRPARAGDLASRSGQGPALAPVLCEMPVEVHAELGSFAMSLAELARLRPGALIPVESPEQGEVTLRVEGVPKFRGIRGRVGNRLAVQLTERLAQKEVGDVGSR